MQTIRVVRKPTELPEKLRGILPDHLLEAIRHCGAEEAEEIRLHRDRDCTVTCGGRNHSTRVSLSGEELADIFQKMCGGSLYAFSGTINEGYLTMDGGIRVGICGSAALESGRVIGVSEITGLVIRIPHRQNPVCTPILDVIRSNRLARGVLIYSPPGVGKTTLLRAIAVEASSGGNALRTVAVDSRSELAYTLDGKHLTLDILVGYPRKIGIEIAVRSLGAQLIVCDEIGGDSDADAVLSAANCGIPLIATAHASNLAELLRRPSILQLHRARVFACYAGIERDGTGGFFYDLHTWEDAENLAGIE